MLTSVSLKSSHRPFWSDSSPSLGQSDSADVKLSVALVRLSSPAVVAFAVSDGVVMKGAGDDLDGDSLLGCDVIDEDKLTSSATAKKRKRG